ncbi:hypothetical protein BBK36DRAFT_1115307 [Trichoderma citrinoviride]|uniref:Vacuolar sorting protein Vps3844 C-terminal domain-containing protein n=1 Tax=Trichoderma citrinoviride TaxID=58853 RepID=A0A2T4BFR4_9HYPO|nr:hypothetical protein BBK36DRAFT_1115307 [Trichoderma citrinoviride]PTB68174.1 hypothetical protein BBK36DRAFT_1115307 [Trichoderma citrinoviride]
MKLTLGIAAALVGCAAASQPAADVYLLPNREAASPPSISSSVAGLITQQRASSGSVASVSEIPDNVDAETVVSLMNQYGSVRPSLFDELTEEPKQLFVMLEGLTEEQIKDTRAKLDVQPSFTIPEVPSTDRLRWAAGLDVSTIYKGSKKEKTSCSFDEMINPLEERCWRGNSLIADFDVQKKPEILNDVINSFSRLASLAEIGEMQVTLLLLPSVGKSSGKKQALNRRQAERVISSFRKTAAPAVPTSPANKNQNMLVSKTPIAACFDSVDSCVSATGNCSHQGQCLDRFKSDAAGGPVCFACHCLSTRETDDGPLTHWAGPTCAKKDISVPFWLFAGFTLLLLGTISLAVTMLYNVGEEKLPGVIGAGVSKLCHVIIGANASCIIQMYSIAVCFCFDTSARSTTNSSKAERPKLPTAKWGAACAPCAAAKAKCIRSNDASGAKCDRCERLLKECSNQIHRPRKKRQAKPSRTSQIEERLNGLVSLLKASGEISETRHHPSSHQGDCNEDPRTEVSSDRPSPYSSSSSAIPSISNQANTWIIDPSYNSFTPKSCICHPDTMEAPPPPESDEVLLDFYRKNLQPVHPFVIIPPNVSAAVLAARRPFLMAAIRMVSSFRSIRSMRAQMYHLMKHIADHMLIRSEKSLDLLLGIIVMLGYQQYHCCLHGQLNNLITLAGSLIGDMGLSKPPGLHERTRLMVVRPPEPHGRSNEERRAFAGAWYWASVISMNFQRVEPMRYNGYLQECIRHLEENPEYDTDISLVYLVKIQRLTERIAELNSRDRASEELSSVPSAPVSAYIHAFQNELNHIRNSMPKHLQEDSQLRLYEPPVIDKNLVRSLSKSLSSVPMTTDSPLDKIYQSSAALTTWFNSWLSLPMSTYYFQTTAVGSHLVYALVMLARWARLATPRAMYEGKTTMPDDPSANNPNVALYNSDMANAQYDPRMMQDKCGMPQGHMPRRPDLEDPDLAAAVAILRTQLQTQPGLMINIPEILSAISSRFEHANATFQLCSADTERVNKNVWMMTALKVRIARAKLEKWAELVAQGAETMNLESRTEADERLADWQAAMHIPQTECAGLDDMGLFADDSLQEPQIENSWGNMAHSSWTTDLLSGFDPNGWFDGYVDWNTMPMHATTSAER